MPDTPIRGTFIPDPPPKRRPSTVGRIAVVAGVGLAVVLGSHQAKDHADTPAPGTTTTTSPSPDASPTP
ncbi:hypothetical protein OG848_47560 (plasmid) [Streptomyces canus]|uniref:hypothetical protein n=1 Tax=Streptomyces canus TaxID=58343 RepID=UPI003252E6CC